MADEERPFCHGCRGVAIITYRILPKGRDAVPTTVHACSMHNQAAKDIGQILSTKTYGEPVIRKLGDGDGS